MASMSPSPVQFIPRISPISDSLRISPRLSGSLPDTQHSPSKIGLVSSHNGQRSYGTVKNFSSSLKRSSLSVIHHTLDEGDTLQGLALKYNVTVHEIQRLNNVWSTDSMYCKTFLKIPIGFHSNESSHTSSPSDSPKTKRRSMTSASNEAFASLPNGGANGTPEHLREGLGDGEEVRSKLSVRRQRSESMTASCGEDGVKNIRDILNCADIQLQTSREFADKLARRSSLHSLPKDAYHRTHEDKPLQSQALSIPAPDRETSPKSKRRLHLKRVDLTPEKMQESRDKLEENLFEL